MEQVLAAIEEAGVIVRQMVPSRGELRRVEVSGVQQDSRAVRPGDLFVAWAGTSHDAHEFLDGAAAAGAAAAVVERPVPGVSVPQIQVDNARLAAAVASGFVAGTPWQGLRMVGVTGTNGKTTTTLLLRGLLGREAGCAAIGTLGVVGPDGRIEDGTEGLTTPGPVQLAEWVAALARAGVAGVVVESSSHALDQFRLDGVRFDVTAFTNLTRDHLDYHGSRDRYLAAKARLLDLGKRGATAVVNADDGAWRALRPGGPVVTYGIRASADLRAAGLRLSSRGSSFELVWQGHRYPVELPLPGGFNVSNALCAAACALALGQEPARVAEGLAEASPVPGRLECIVRKPFDVLVDFAHTPDALDQVLKALRPLVSRRLIVVFGAGGDRDPTKRPEMGAAASRHADLVVVTSDNPRTEDPVEIAAQVSRGVSAADAVEIVDRREAIWWALDRAEPGDAVLLAGKGHEAYQIVGTEKRPFDEREIVLDYLDTAS
ncbi:MAG: UDP-N-acetylmuramoyl-L-alanyl-D-glutamate--2,6-diaminopimelate ligase [Gemmatimonadota bacterium]|nr:UDP-N-acetylmuramoyl-L-alanyl-D-glutamate--2,6-diaminopimelate ligase [Gemmatimonadota bacterium]